LPNGYAERLPSSERISVELGTFLEFVAFCLLLLVVGLGCVCFGYYFNAALA